VNTPKILKVAGIILSGLVLVAAPAAGETRHPVNVRVVSASYQNYPNSISLTGEIAAQHTLTLAFRISGQITERFVEVGQHVEPGEVLAKLDDSIQNADLTAARAAMDAAQAQLDQVTAELERSKELLDQGFTTRAAFERVEASAILAQGRLDLVEAQVELAQDNLTFANLIAPTSGIITVSHAKVGQIAQLAQPMFTLAENGKRDAVFDVQETVFIEQSDEISVEISLLERPEISVECYMREVSPIVDPHTGTVRVRCGIDNPPPSFSLGTIVRGTANLGSESVIVLPWSALGSLRGNPAVWIYDPTVGTVSKREIEVERYENGRIVIRSGLEDGNLVVVDGTKFLFEGMSVLPMAESLE